MAASIGAVEVLAVVGAKSGVGPALEILAVAVAVGAAGRVAEGENDAFFGHAFFDEATLDEALLPGAERFEGPGISFDAGLWSADGTAAEEEGNPCEGGEEAVGGGHGRVE